MSTAVSSRLCQSHNSLKNKYDTENCRLGRFLPESLNLRIFVGICVVINPDTNNREPDKTDMYRLTKTAGCVLATRTAVAPGCLGL
jgi:hypothetical protein